MELARGNQSANVKGGVERELETRKVFGAFVLFLFSMAVPYFVMLNVRLLMAGGYVPSSVDQATGAIHTALMVLSAITAIMAWGAVKRGNVASYRSSLLWSILLGTLATLMLIWQFWFHPFDAMSHYGETFLSTIGLCAVMNITGILTLSASRSRIKRLGLTDALNLGYRTATLYWVFLVVCWLVMYAELYFV